MIFSPPGSISPDVIISSKTSIDSAIGVLDGVTSTNGTSGSTTADTYGIRGGLLVDGVLYYSYGSGGSSDSEFSNRCGKGGKII